MLRGVAGELVKTGFSFCEIGIKYTGGHYHAALAEARIAPNRIVQE